MKPQTSEWVEKAEGDWNMARQLKRVRKDVNYDGVCFHCQQSVEKYLKARLEEAGISFPRTHDLIKLLALAIQVELKWAALQPIIAALPLMPLPIVILGLAQLNLMQRMRSKLVAECGVRCEPHLDYLFEEDCWN